MADELDAVRIDGAPLFTHIGFQSAPMRFSEIDALDAELPDFGNRFDVVGGGVLYAATEKRGAYKETISAFRPATSSLPFDDPATFMTLGAVPAEWREQRRVVTFSLNDALPFVDIEKDETLSYLTRVMARQLADLGIDKLDTALVRGSNRLLTRAIAAWAYTAVDEDEEAAFSGIRYSSRFESHECWAIFEGVEFGDTTLGSIEKSDPALLAAAHEFGLTVH